ncbi:Crp/Fnr family transcriptional regulator [Niabella drilacis]|uniref:cAMP-binding domain of CRP or a regulatory subunit of cAMP-dependent protein kinases n=1 Tax=Niabella drilacis (strain DSM 25811 / CCM 8410 / CCUG 62505 / LMG 26954 / E90) TaxID=1285928 RepID=A0A1G6WIS8_NIADE|nr:Crp/Fnr family transcriptional regulator [Niabella drilacis]SDD64966.1 cAMP-binding domain of CRP or a regulatory subunit of cAMP-dependent protein kinases [Niabella drilacis]
MEHFFVTVAQYATLSEQSRQELVKQLQKQVLPRGTILVRPDTTCKCLYFIDKGLTRTYYLKDGKDITDWISDENSFACSIISFITRRPDRRGIEILEDTVLYVLHRDVLDELCARYHDIEHLFRMLVAHGLIQLQQKFDDLHFATALERYKILMQSNPSFIQRVPLGMIASYLGITQETLSRIRAQI